MSWIVTSLLNERERLKEEHDLDSDEFNDLILVERAIQDLLDSKKLSESEVELLFSQVPKNLSKAEKYTLNKKRSALCERVAYYMGDYFTDEGYIDYMQKKHNLSEAQADVLRKYINSEYKFKIMRKPIDNE